MRPHKTTVEPGGDDDRIGHSAAQHLGSRTRWTSSSTSTSGGALVMASARAGTIAFCSGGMGRPSQDSTAGSTVATPSSARAT